MTRLFAAIVGAALSVMVVETIPPARADGYCELGNLLISQEVHHVGTYREATCAMVDDIVATSNEGSCLRAVTNYVVNRGYDPYVAKDVALHNC